jgi:hypothetical protein
MRLEGGSTMPGKGPRSMHWRIFVALAAPCALATAALAHHGWSGYDAEKTLTLTGIIREAGYESPHGYVNLEVKEESGTKTWHAVLAPPSRMQARGLPREALKVGATVTVVGYPSRTDAGEMRAERIIIDGKTTELR